jgi:hypothetical protein
MEDTSLHRVPPESTIGLQWSAGLKLHDLAASGGVSHRLVERRLHALSVMLASDPLSVFNFVPLPATGADGLRVAVSIRDDLSVKLALAANDPELL